MKNKKYRKILFVLSLWAICLATGLILGNNFKPAIPSEIENIIEKEARHFALDPDFIKAIILVESGGKPISRSKKGALGLMQLMPGTAKELAEKSGISLKSQDDLLQPEINIHLGCYYLHLLMRRFYGDMPSVLASYNTGPSRVSGWLQEDQTESSQKIVEQKASLETRRFVKRVTQAYQMMKNRNSR